MLWELELRLQRLLSDLRKLEYLMATDRFIGASKIAKENQANFLRQLTEAAMSNDSNLREMALEDLREYCDHLTGRDVSVTKLRERASMLCIRNYSRLSRDELIEAINKRLIYAPRGIFDSVRYSDDAHRSGTPESVGDCVQQGDVPEISGEGSGSGAGLAQELPSNGDSQASGSVDDAHSGDVEKI